MKFEVRDEVRYNGINRPVLKDRKGIIMTFAENGRSALVDFPRTETERGQSEWVGVDYLHKVTENTYSISSLTEKRDSLLVEYNDLTDQRRAITARVNEISRKREAIAQAILQIQNLEKD